MKVLGGLYLLYLTYSHFWGREEGEDRRQAPKATGMLGLTPFWATVVRVELINLAFSIDSILVAVAMSPKLWVVITGGILGIVAMRLVAGQLIVLVQRYPALVDGAFIIIAWVGLKLCLEYLHEAHFIALDIPKWLSLGHRGRDLHRCAHLRADAGSGRERRRRSRTKQRRCSRPTRSSSPRSTAT